MILINEKNKFKQKNKIFNNFLINPKCIFYLGKA